MKDDMTRLELLTVMLSIKALLESDNVEKAKELIDEVIAEAKRISRSSRTNDRGRYLPPLFIKLIISHRH